MFVLKRAISGLLAGTTALVAFTASASPHEMGWIIVEANVGAREPIYLGTSNRYEEWNNDVTPEEGWTNNPFAPDACDVLAANGRPQDCDRAVASGLLQPPEMPPIPSFIAFNGQLVTHPAVFYTLAPIYSINNSILVNCYQNPGTNPSECEADYVDAFRAECIVLETRDSLEPGSRYNPRDACLAAVELSQTRVANAKFDRTLAEWFGLKLGYQLGPFAVELNRNLLTDMLSLNPYNRALIYARQYQACSSWYRVFDARNCGAQYHGFG